ncbi:MAG: hypothetical protein NTY66_02975 [Candidatus Vogelbacteria bacterium]|nr:hypothetical protein [Candidatus Vogelbacteria bacterium]
MKQSSGKIIFTALVFCAPLFALAFYESPATQFSATVEPRQAEPGQEVSITINSYSLGLDSCLIDWKKDGVSAAQGIGKKVFGFKMPELVALPQVYDANGKIISDNSLIYRWKINGRLISSGSGYGKRFLDADFTRESDTITVEVSSPTQELKALKTINLPTQKPILLVYENNLLNGPQYQKSLQGTFNLNQSELPLVVEPYFIPNSSLPKLSLTWGMNGKQVGEGPGITLRQELSVGESLISILARGIEVPIDNELLVKFGQKSSIF